MHPELNWSDFYFDSIGSTNTECFSLYKEKGNNILPFCVVAKRQSQGRGQFDKKWSSPEGNLYCSLALSKSFAEWYLQERLEEAELTLKIGEIVFASIEEIIRDIETKNTEISASNNSQNSQENKSLNFNLAKLEIKKPNDILYDGKKLAGILLEVKEDLLVIGIGINVKVAPEIEANDKYQEAIALKQIYQEEITTELLLQRIKDKLEATLQKNYHQ